MTINIAYASDDVHSVSDVDTLDSVDGVKRIDSIEIIISMETINTIETRDSIQTIKIHRKLSMDMYVPPQQLFSFSHVIYVSHVVVVTIYFQN